MKEMYQSVQKEKKQEKRWSLKISGAVATGLILVVVLTVLWAVRYELNYRAYISYLSNSKTYAVGHHTLRANVQGDLVWVKGSNAEKLYAYLLVAGKGRVGNGPAGQPEIAMEFGDGGTLKIWETEGKFHSYVLYQHEDGYSYGYYSGQIYVGTVATNYLSLSENVVWTGELNIS